MGYITQGIPKDIVRQIATENKIDNFVETGTYMGNTCFWAAAYFKNVYTIEIDPEISKNTANRLKDMKNIKFLVGDSSNILPGLLKDISESTLFWLDGHYSGPSTGGIEYECPLMQEIEAISTFDEPIILIDDARLFMGPLPEPHNSNQWPLIDEIFHALMTKFPNNSTTIHDDVIICVPKKMKHIIDRDWSNKFNQRYPIKHSSFIGKIKEKVIRFFK
jgi:hypothetical protein